MSEDVSPVSPSAPETLLSPLEARVLGCLIEKELTTPDVYPLTLNSLVAACSQRSNRHPVIDVTPREVEAALELLRGKRLAVLFSGAEARVPKFKHTLDHVYPMEVAPRVLLAELLLRGPQTTAELRMRAERMAALPDLAGVEQLLTDLAARPGGALVVRLPRQPGQKEARWAQLLTGTPAPESAAESAAPRAPLTVSLTLPPEVEQRLAALEREVTSLRDEVAALKRELGVGG